MTQPKKARLGINIDHVATLRNQRGEHYPSLVRACETVLDAGADQITIHLREDRRHIQDTDVPSVQLVTQRYQKLLNLELANSPEIVSMARDLKVDWICIVPEKREEKTTEGGLGILNEEVFKKTQSSMKEFRKGHAQGKVSLFIEADLEVCKKAYELGADAVEIHTGLFAKAALNQEDLTHYIETYKALHNYCLDVGLGFHAGHGLTLESTKYLSEYKLFEEFNIGHWVISESVFRGLGPVVSDLLKVM